MNIDEIVKQSGVSRSTVFRFLRGNNVRGAARDAIISAMQSLGYENEKVLNENLDLEIEISASEDMDNFLGFTQVINGITFAADEHGIRVRLVRRNPSQFSNAYDKSFSRNKGVIVIGKSIDDERLEAGKLTANNIKHVFINRVFSDSNISYVAVNLVEAGFDITRYLLAMGHRNIAILGDTQSLRVDRDKIQGYKNALSKSDIPVSELLCITDAKKERIDMHLESFFKNGNVPDAFVGICDTYAMKFIAIAEKHGFKVPRDIAVVGMDDVASSEFFRPALTTVHVPFYEIGVLAVDSILKQMIKNVKSTQIILNHNIVIRQSCSENSNNKL